MCAFVVLSCLLLFGGCEEKKPDAAKGGKSDAAKTEGKGEGAGTEGEAKVEAGADDAGKTAAAAETPEPEEVVPAMELSKLTPKKGDDGRWAYFDEAGEAKITVNVDNVSAAKPFQGQVAFVMVPAEGMVGAWLFIDAKGEKVMPEALLTGPGVHMTEKNAYCVTFHNKTQTTVDDRWGMMLDTGAVVLEGKFKNMNCGPTTAVGMGEDGMWGLYDNNGFELLKPEWKAVRNPNAGQGFATVSRDMSWGLFAMESRALIEPTYARCSTQGNQATCVDLEGKEVKFDQLGNILPE